MIGLTLYYIPERRLKWFGTNALHDSIRASERPAALSDECINCFDELSKSDEKMLILCGRLCYCSESRIKSGFWWENCMQATERNCNVKPLSISMSASDFVFLVVYRAILWIVKEPLCDSYTAAALSTANSWWISKKAHRPFLSSVSSVPGHVSPACAF